MEFNFLSIIFRFHSVIGFLQFSPALHLQYLQQLTPATLQGHAFLRAHLPHLHGSKRPSSFVIKILGTIKVFFHSKP
jgi:hypothetical protein